MSVRRIKTPDGKLVTRHADPLERLLSGSAPARTPVFRSVDAATDSSTTQSHSSYATEGFDYRRLDGSEVTVFGAGALGGYLSWSLASARLVQNVVDCKNVQSKHTCGGRTIYDPLQIGMKKVDALKQKIEKNHSGTTVRPYACDVAQIPDIELKLMFRRSVLVALAIDDPQQILRVSDMAYPVVELIQVAAHSGAQSGHVAISMPLVTPCLRCTLGIADAGQLHRLDSEPGSSWHIARIAHEAATVAIDIIYSKVTGQIIANWDTSKNLVYIANTRQDVSPDGPGIKYEASRRRPGCPVCDNLSGRLEGSKHEH